jgi:prepilin-type N-terminal cleavage/methylation domain-containing protein
VSERFGLPPATADRARRAVARGFTILELVLVLAVVTIIAAISIWAYFARPEVTLDNAALLLARDMRIAQNRAVLLRHPVYLVFFKEGDGYRIVDELEESAFSRAGFERVERCFSRDAIFEGVKILHLGLAANDRVVFPPDGGEPPAGRLMLSYGSETRTLEIEGGTGRILLTERASDKANAGL